jgi:hypothetical protein
MRNAGLCAVRAGQPSQPVLGVEGWFLTVAMQDTKQKAKSLCCARRSPLDLCVSPRRDAAGWNGVKSVSQVPHCHGCLPHLARPLVSVALPPAGHSPLALQPSPQPQQPVEALSPLPRKKVVTLLAKLLTMSVWYNEILRRRASIGRCMRRTRHFSIWCSARGQEVHQKKSSVVANSATSQSHYHFAARSTVPG